MNILRRSFIFGSVAASVFISLWDINPSKAEVKVGESAEDKKLIIKMVGMFIHTIDFLKLHMKELPMML